MTDQHDITEMEARINALIDGTLSRDDMRKLKQEATEDSELAQAIIEAHQIQSALDELGTMTAPQTLRSQLRSIPSQYPRERQPLLFFRWFVPAATTAALALVLGIAHMNPKSPPPPTSAELAQAQQELAVALTYLKRYSQRTNSEIQSEVGGAIRGALFDGIRTGVELENTPS